MTCFDEEPEHQPTKEEWENIMQTKEQTIERVKKVIVESLGVKEERVTPTALFENDLGADSLDLAELSMKLEEEFDIVITDDESVKISKEPLQFLYNFVAMKLTP